MRRHSQIGFSLIELAIVIAILSGIFVGVARWQLKQTQTNIATNVAVQLRALAEAGKKYTVANATSLKAATGPTTPYVVTQAALIAGAYLPANTALTNYFQQTSEVVVTQDASGNLLPIAVTLGGQPMDGGMARQVAQLVTVQGGAGGYITNAANDTPGPTVATGASGWQVTLANYGINPGAGHVVDAIFFTQQTAQSNLDLALHRVATDGQPQLNTMSNDFNMGANNITNANAIQSN